MKKIRFLFFLALLLMTAVGAKADGLVVTSNDIGKVLCTDGSIYATVSAATGASKTPAAMIAYVGTNTGLAIALADVIITYNEGYDDEYTVEKWTWHEAWDKASEHTPSVTSGTWKLPTVLEWKQMLIDCGSTGTVDDDVLSYGEMAAKLANAGGTGLNTDTYDYYWTATENSDYSDNAHVLEFSDNNASFSGTFGKGSSAYVRPCLAFDIVSARDIAAATTEDIGKIVGANGKIYNSRDDLPAGVDAAAMLAYVDTENGTGLAIALDDDSLGYWVGPQGGMLEYKYLRTFSWSPAKYAAKQHAPLVPNGTWKLPSADEFKNILSGCSDDEVLPNSENSEYTMTWNHLNSKLSSVGGISFQSDDAYWLEDAGEGSYAWSMEFVNEGVNYNANFYNSLKNDNFLKARACLVFSLSDELVPGYIGKVLCTDGNIYSSVPAATGANKTPLAMITYIDENNGTGLAIALNNEDNPMQWSDANTASNTHTPTLRNATWRLPTVIDWQKMLTGCGAAGNTSGDVMDPISYSELNSKLSKAGIAPLPSGDYWTATVNEIDSHVFANYLELANNQADFNHSVDLFYNCNVRACLEFNLAEIEKMSVSDSEAGLGRVVCSNGYIYDADKVPADKTPIGMIAFVDLEQRKGLAIALNDESGTMNWDVATSTATAHTPAIPGITWKLPTAEEWKQMLLGTDLDGSGIWGSDFSIDDLNSRLSAVSGAKLLSNDDYWASDMWVDDEYPYYQYAEYAGIMDDIARFYGTSLSEIKKVRACFSFDLDLTTHTITIDEDCANNVTSNKLRANEGETVGLTITNIPEGQYVDDVIVYYLNDYNNEVQLDITPSIYNDNVFTFEMPAYPVTVSSVNFGVIPVAQEVDGIYYILKGKYSTAEVAPHPNHGYSGYINVPISFYYNNKWYSVTSVGREAFANYNNNEITSVTLGSNVGIIRRDAFYNSTIAYLDLGSRLKKIEQYAFREGNYSIVIPSSVDNISTWAFKGFRGNLMSVESGNEKYDSRDDCNAIIETATNTIVAGCINSTIPSTVTTIGEAAFDGVGFTSIEIPANVTTLDLGAYANNPIYSVFIPETVTDIWSNPFYGCNELTYITVDPANPNYDSRDDCNAICDTERNWIIATCKSSVIPTSITSIGTYAFAYREDLNEFKVPSHINVIYDNAFAYSNLWNITLADNNNLTIWNWAFAQCKELRTVKMGRGISKIEDRVMQGCPKLSNIYINAALAPKIQSTTFVIDDAGTLTTAKVHVPSASLKTYQNANVWRDLNLNLVASDAVQGVTATFESVNNNKVCSAASELITEEGTIWDCSASSVSITTHGGETCLQASSSPVTLSNCSTNGFIINGPVKRIVVRAANVTGITCEIVDISVNPNNTTADQSKSVTGLTAIETLQDFALNVDDGSKEYTKAKVKVTITGTSPIYVQSISIVQGGGDYVITDESSTTVQGVEYSNTMSAPGSGDIPEAVINNVPVYVYTTCLPTTPVRDTGLKFYTLSSSTNTSLQFAEVTGALQANTPYLVAVSQDAEIGMSVENESVTLKKESDNYSLSSDGAYKFVGTTTGLTNAEAVAASAYILQDGNVWGQVTAENFEAYIPPFRAYIVPIASGSRSMLSGGFTDATGIKSLQLTDRDGSTHFFDLSGRRISSPAVSGVYVTNGKKVIIKK